MRRKMEIEFEKANALRDIQSDTQGANHWKQKFVTSNEEKIYLYDTQKIICYCPLTGRYIHRFEIFHTENEASSSRVKQIITWCKFRVIL